MDRFRSVQTILSGIDVFIGGPIQHALRGDALINKVQDPIISAIDAVTDAGGNVFSAHVAEAFGKQTAYFTPDEVSVRDFRWMNKCDVFVPVLPIQANGALVRTDGTHVELGWASALRRPIVLVTAHPFTEDASHLLKGLPRVGQVTVLGIDEFLKDPLHLATIIARVVGTSMSASLPRVAKASTMERPNSTSPLKQRGKVNDNVT
ncbi:MAG: hypothetical protein CPSOU_6692 [uncultured Paraburkholderia sp.]|nr:MAG: hypothetical protein CPSOU_6692 [uncultured Paraburkholderia sp.]